MRSVSLLQLSEIFIALPEIHTRFLYIFYVVITDGDTLVRLVTYPHDHRLVSNNVVVVGWWQYWSVIWERPIEILLKLFVCK